MPNPFMPPAPLPVKDATPPTPTRCHALSAAPHGGCRPCRRSCVTLLGGECGRWEAEREEEGWVIATPRVSAATPDDLRELGSLREEQGWQRNEALLGAIVAWEHGRIFVVRESALETAHATPHAGPHGSSHAIVATTAVVAAGAVGAVGNVIVRSDARRRGLARLVVTTALEWMRERGVRYAHLDATQDGRPLYRSLGFVEVTPSWFAHAPLPDIDMAALRARGGDLRARLAGASELPRYAALDRAAYGGDRLGLLTLVLAGAHAWLYVCDDRAGAPAGYLLLRGLEAPYVGVRAGPWVATDEDTAAALLRAAFDAAAPWRRWLGSRAEGEADVFLSPPGTNPRALALLEAAGVRVVQDDVVMQLSLAQPGAPPQPAMPRPDWQYAWLAPMVF